MRSFMLQQAMLQQVAASGGDSTPLSGYVLNVNVPSVPFSELRGYYLARQGMACVYPRFQEVRRRASSRSHPCPLSSLIMTHK